MGLLAHQVYQLWASDYVTGTRAAVAWTVGLVVLVLPCVCLCAVGVLSACRGDGSTAGVGGQRSVVAMAGGALVAPYRPGCLWFGAVVLLDRLVFAVVVVVASRWPVLQLVLVRTSALCGATSMSVRGSALSRVLTRGPDG